MAVSLDTIREPAPWCGELRETWNLYGNDELDSILPLNFAPVGVNITDNFTQTMKSNWLTNFAWPFGGFTLGPVLFYATGGLAVANVSYTDFGYFPFLPSSNAASRSKIRAGSTVGGATE